MMAKMSKHASEARTVTDLTKDSGRFGYGTNLLMPAEIAGVGVALYLMSMPETRGHFEKAKSA